MNNFFELVNTRQSVRRFSERHVEEEKLVKCLDAARLAPSASNAQPWTIIVVNEPGLVKEVASHTYDPVLTFNRFVTQAPVIVAMVIEKTPMKTRLGSVIKNRDFPLTDHGIAASHFCLMAAELGLGTCMLGWFNEKKVKQLLNIPRKKRLSMLIAVGYPPGDYPLRQKVRKSLGTMAFYNRYPGRGI